MNRYQTAAQKRTNDWCTQLRRENTRLKKENEDLKKYIVELRSVPQKK